MRRLPSTRELACGGENWHCLHLEQGRCNECVANMLLADRRRVVEACAEVAAWFATKRPIEFMDGTPAGIANPERVRGDHMALNIAGAIRALDIGELPAVVQDEFAKWPPEGWFLSAAGGYDPKSPCEPMRNYRRNGRRKRSSPDVVVE